MEKSLKTKTFLSLVWRFAERCGAQLVSFIVSIVLARLILPEEYGVVSLINVFTNILQVFIDSGLGTALVQKREADDLDFSSVFYFNFVICLLLYIFMFFFAPAISKFYNNPELTLIIRVMSLTLIISGVKNIQQAYVSRHMLFKRFFFSTIGGTLFSAILGIAMAYKGLGVWALIAQQLSNVMIGTLILWLTVNWRPKWQFSWDRLSRLLSYGWKLLISALLDTAYNNLGGLVIGKAYTSSDLAYYNRGRQFPELVVTNINTSIDSVLLPVLSNVQEQKTKVKAMTRKAIRTSSFFMWPLMVGLAVCAEPLILLLLTKKWLFCVPFLRIFCFSYVFYPIHTANLNAIKAMGRSDIFLKLEIIKKIIGIISIFIAVQISVTAIAWSFLITAPINALVNAFPNKSLLKYSFKEQIFDIFPYMCLAFLMGGIVFAMQYASFSTIIQLCVQILLGTAIYVIGAKILRFEEMDFITNILSKVIDKFKGIRRKNG